MLKIGEIGENKSGFQTVTVCPSRIFKRFEAVEAESGRGGQAKSIILSGHAVEEIPPGELDRSAVNELIRPSAAGDFVVSEGVVVELPIEDGESLYLCGPNGGTLEEIDLIKSYFFDEDVLTAALSQK
ncbi:MAG TPA: hypothetical protein VFX86_01775 [Candidatus Saccharimonadales bacterium]|nr:hypothetical protein [Candidatus Saccharimonadales bacterium]